MTFKTPYPGYTLMDITEHDELMRALEGYVKCKHPQSIVDWLPLKEASAYILSLA